MATVNAPGLTTRGSTGRGFRGNGAGLSTRSASAVLCCAAGRRRALEEKMPKPFWEPPIKTRKVRRPKGCTLCLRLYGHQRPRGSREFCDVNCREIAKAIDNILKHNPRYAPRGIRLFLLQRARYTCKYCSASVTWRTANVEHMKAWPKGKTVLRNLTIACRGCNKNKLRGRLRPHILKAVKRGLLVTRC